MQRPCGGSRFIVFEEQKGHCDWSRVWEGHEGHLWVWSLSICPLSLGGTSLLPQRQCCWGTSILLRRQKILPSLFRSHVGSWCLYRPGSSSGYPAGVGLSSGFSQWDLQKITNKISTNRTLGAQACQWGPMDLVFPSWHLP